METKERIVREALRLFLDRGYERASLNEVAEAVGITKPAIYHHFEGKEALFQAVLDLFFEEMGKWSAARFGTCRTLEELLAALFASIGAFQRVAHILLGEEEDGTPSGVLELFLTASRKDPAFRGRLGEGLARSRSALAEKLSEARERGEIRADVDCDVLAFEIHALIEGTGLIASIDHSVDMDAVGRSMFDSTWRLIAGSRADRAPGTETRSDT
jgi:AcrR family transcriptional regulator